MPGPFDFTGQNISNTYQRVVQVVSGSLHDGTGSLFIPTSASYAVTASYAISASHEIVKEVSSSYAETASFANNFTVQNGLTANNISASTYYGDGSNLTGIETDPFPYTGSAEISGSLDVDGNIDFTGKINNTSIYSGGQNNGSTWIIPGVNSSENTANAYYQVRIGGFQSPSTNPQRIVYIGYGAGQSRVGNENLAIGHNAGSYGGNSYVNVGSTLIGTSAGIGHNKYSTIIGNSAGQGVKGVYTLVQENVSIGRAAGGNVINYSTTIGSYSGRALLGDYNITIGHHTGYNGIGDNLIFLGKEAGYNASGSNNILIGYQAGYNLTGSNQLIIANNSSSALITGDFAEGTLHISGTILATTGSFSHLKGNSPITVQDPVIFQHDQGLDVLGNATVNSLNNVELQTISKDFNYTSSLNVAEITSSVEGAIIDYRLTRLDSGSRVGTFMYAHDGTTLSYNDTTIPGAGLGDEPTLSATLDTGSSIVSIDIENAAGFNFSGFAKKFSKLDSAVPVADPNVSYLLTAYPSENYVVAYSVRQVNQSYTGPAIKIRRTSDNTEADIDFDVNGNLDTESIETFCGSSEGRVSIWYDQSGNNNHASQSTAELQGLIYNGTSIQTNNNGLPHIYSTANNYSGPTGIDWSSGISMYQVVQATGYNQYTPVANGIYGWGFIHSTYQDGFYVGNGSNNRRLANMNGLRNDSYLVLEAGLYDGTNVYAYMHQRYNGVSQPLATGTNTGGISTGDTTGWDMSFGRGRYQEFIVLNEYNNSNRAAFLTNMNNYFDVTDTGLLVDYPNASAAYSVRQLTTAFTSSMNIRRASDNTEQVIGFTSAGDLDTGSIETFCAGTECYVDTWYDQSGNGNHAEQTSAAKQPLIYSASAVITESGNPAIKFTHETSQTLSALNYTSIPATRFYHVWVMNQPINQRFNWMVGTSYYRLETNGQMYLVKPNDFDNAYGDIGLTGYKLRSINRDSDSTATAYVDGTSSNAWTGLDASAFTFNKVDGNFVVPGTGYHVNIQEFIIYDSDQSSNRTGIETNINSYFNIYP